MVVCPCVFPLVLLIKLEVVQQTETHWTLPQVEVWPGGTQPMSIPEPSCVCMYVKIHVSRCEGLNFSGKDILSEICAPNRPHLEALPIFIAAMQGQIKTSF